MSFLTQLSHSRYRVLLPLPMIIQMTATLWMALFGRPSTRALAPDWVMHVSAYFILFFLVWIGFHGLFPRNHPEKHRLTAFVTTVSFAILDEWLQSLVRVRSGELSDVFADVTGAFLAVVILSVLFRLKLILDAARHK